MSLRRGPRSSSLPGRLASLFPDYPASLKPGLFPEWSLLVHSIISSPGHRWLRSCGMLQRTCSGSNRPTRTTDAITRTAMPLLLSTSFRTVLHRVGAGIYCSRVQPVLIVHNHFSPPDPGPELSPPSVASPRWPLCVLAQPCSTRLSSPPLFSLRKVPLDKRAQSGAQVGRPLLVRPPQRMPRLRRISLSRSFMRRRHKKAAFGRPGHLCVRHLTSWYQDHSLRLGVFGNQLLGHAAHLAQELAESWLPVHTATARPASKLR